MYASKIIYFMDHYTNFGGAANTLLSQAILMKRAGKSVSVVVSDWWEICKDYLSICAREEIRVYTLRYFVTSQPEGVDVFSIFDNYDDVKGFLREHSPDVVHSVQLNPVVELVCRELEIPHIMNIYQVIPDFFKFEYADIFPRYHICDSLYYANMWKKYLGTKSYCIRTVAEESDKKEHSVRLDNFRFVCVGLLCERKNQLEVIKAFESAIKFYGLNGKLRIFGHIGTTYAEACSQYIINHGLQECVNLEGFSENMETVYADSDVLICGSTRESFPNVISEALAHNIVVISTPVAGVPEVIRDGENGYLSKGYQAENLVECIQRFCQDVRTGSLNKILENERAAYEKIHSPKAVTLKLLQCYENVLADYKIKSRYTIKELRNDFSGFIDIFYKYQDYFTSNGYVKANLWKIHYVIKLLEKLSAKHDFYIWGTGKYGKMYKEILDIFAPKLTITGFIDSYAKGYYMEHEIVELDEVLDNDQNIILLGIAVKRSEIVDILNQNGFYYNDNYFTFEPHRW